jgi:DNA topoisomerase VI subunit B
MEIQLALKLTREWKSKAKQELLDNNSILEATSKALNKAERNFKNRIKKKKWFQKSSKKYILMTYGLSGNGPKAHETIQYLPYLEDQAEQK